MPSYLIHKSKYFLLFLFLLLVPLPFTDVLIDPYNLPRFLFFSAALMTGFWFMRTQDLVFPPLFLFILLVAFYVMNLASCLWSINLGEALYESQKVFMGLCTVAFFLNYIRSDEAEVLLVRSFLWLTACVCLFVTAELIRWGAEDLHLVNGFSENVSLNSSLLMLLMPFSIYALLIFRGAYSVFGALLLGWLLFLVSLLCIKSVCLGASAGMAMIVLAGYKLQSRVSRKTFLFFGSALLILISAFLLRDIILPLLSGHRWSELIPEEKWRLWEKTWTLFKQHPFWGIGAANWPFYIMQYGVEDLPTVIQTNLRFLRPENDLLWVLAETGIACFIVLLLKMITILYYSAREIVKRRNLKVLIFFSFLCALIVHASFSYPKERTTHIVMSCLLLALLLRNLEPGSHMTLRARFPLYLGLMVLFFGFLVGLVRFFSEKHVKKMAEANTQNQMEEVVSFGINAMNRIYETQPDGRPVAWSIGSAYDVMGRTDSACYYFEMALRSSPYDFEVLHQYSKTLQRINDPRAQTMLKRAKKINPYLE